MSVPSFERLDLGERVKRDVMGSMTCWVIFYMHSGHAAAVRICRVAGRDEVSLLAGLSADLLSWTPCRSLTRASGARPTAVVQPVLAGPYPTHR